MSWKKIIILLLVLFVLGVAIYFVTQQEKQKQEKEGKLFSIIADKIAKIELQRGEQRFVFARSGTLWNLEEPMKTQADKVTVENILDEFATLKYDKLVEKDVRDLKNYGLDLPRIKLNFFESGQSNPSYTILIGMKNEIDQSSYAKLYTGSEVVLVASYKINHLEKELFDFRNKKFMGFESTDVSSMAYNYEGSSFSFAKNENQWMMEKPVFSVADDIKVTDIINKAASLEAKAFKEKTTQDKLKEYGFEKPLIDAIFKLEEKSKVLEVVKKDDKYYAYCPDFSEICEVEKELVDKFIKEVKDLRSHKVIKFYAFDCKGIQFKSPGLQFQMKKNKENAWDLVKSTTKEKVDDEKVTSLLTALEELAVTEFIDQPQKKYEFVYSIQLNVEESGSQVKTLEIELTSFQDDAVIARNLHLPYYFKVSKEIADKMPKNLEDLLKKTTEETKK